MKAKSGVIIFTGGAIGGLSYWFQPYGDQQIFGLNVWLLMGVGAFLGSLLLSFLMKTKPSQIAKLTTFGILLSVMGRIIYDTIFWDSTSHNLMPFEIGYCLIVSVPATLFGAFVPKILGYKNSGSD